MEDVKTFLRILGLLLTLGPLFFIDIPSLLMGLPSLVYTQAFMKTLDIAVIDGRFLMVALSDIIL